MPALRHPRAPYARLDDSSAAEISGGRTGSRQSRSRPPLCGFCNAFVFGIIFGSFIVRWSDTTPLSVQATREQLQLPTQVEAEDLAPQMQRANHTLEDPARRKTPEVRLTLRSVGWTGSEKATHEEGVVVDILVVDDEGRAEAMHAADYAGPLQTRDRPLLPLGLCPGERHSVSAWALRPTGGKGTPPLASTSATMPFELYKERVASATTGKDTALATAAVREGRTSNTSRNPVDASNQMETVYENDGTGRAFQHEEPCDKFERQPPLLVRGHRDRSEYRGILCRVCSHRSTNGRARGDGANDTRPFSALNGFHSRKRLLLRTSLRAEYNDPARAEQDGETNNRYHGKEWTIELREGDSLVTAARKFASSKLGLRIHREDTRPGVPPPSGAADVGARTESADAAAAVTGVGVESGVASGTSQTEITADEESGERVVQWIVQRLKGELAERQTRRIMKRMEATQTVSRTGQLRIVIGAERDGNSPRGTRGWMNTDVNTLDVTDSSDFEYILGKGRLVDSFFAEHVWEHLSLQDAHRAARNCYRHLRPGGRLRLAVPDPRWYEESNMSDSEGARDSFKENAVAQSRGSPTSLDSYGHQWDIDEGTVRFRGRETRNGEEGRREADQGREDIGNDTDEKTDVEPLPQWLNADMLAADIRDGHLVQYTPELLGNVCWSVGFTPVLNEGGGICSDIRRERAGRAAAPAARSEHIHIDSVSSTKNVADSTFTANDAAVAKEKVQDKSDNRRKESGVALDGCRNDSVDKGRGPFPSQVRSESAMSESARTADEELWGRVERSFAGGDPRGCVSIVMDCVKPRDDESEAMSSAKVPFAISSATSTITGTAAPPTFTLPAPESLPGRISHISAVTYDIAGAPEDGYVPRAFHIAVNADNRADVDNRLTNSFSSSSPSSYEAQSSRNDASPHRGAPASEGVGSETNGTMRPSRRTMHEWAAEARQQGRVHPPSTATQEILDTGTQDAASTVTGGTISAGSALLPPTARPTSSSSTTHEGGASSLNELIDMRGQAKEALLAGNAVATLQLCQSLLEESPIDALALVYKGAAMALSGDWQAAWENTERVLALARGTDESAATVRRDHNVKYDGHGQRDQQNTCDDAKDLCVSLAITLDAVGNLASFARARAFDTLDPHAETFLLLEGLIVAAERDATDPVVKDAADRGANMTGEHSIGTVPRDSALVFGGLKHILAMAARALEERGQLMMALRLYQRIILLGSHDDQRTLNGLGELSHRILHMEREKRKRPAQIPTPTSSSTAMGDEDRARVGQGIDVPTASTVSSEGWCDWSIEHPRPGQVFSVDDLMPVHLDLTQLDTGLPSAGSTFGTVTADAGGGAQVHGDSLVTRDGLAVLVCSYLEDFEGAHCLPEGVLYNIEPGWHTLTAEAYQLPALTPLVCPGDDTGGAEDSMRRVRFCVGDTIICGRDEGQPSTSSPTQDSTTEPTTSTLSSPRAAGLSAGHVAASEVETTGAASDVDLPFCFMTLALNAMPFITHHAPVFAGVGEALSERAALAFTEAAAARTSRGAPSVSKGHNGSASPSPQVSIAAKPFGFPPPEAFWQWHVVEGVAAGRADYNNPYSTRRIPDYYYDSVTGLSVDGTTQYLDDLVEQQHGQSDFASSMRKGQIRLHRRCGRQRSKEEKAQESNASKGSDDERPRRVEGSQHGVPTNSAEEADGLRTEPRYGHNEVGEEELPGTSGDRGGGDNGGDDDSIDWGSSSCLWRDKIQMVNSVAFSLERECLLVQIDADELWTVAQLVELRDMFLQERRKISDTFKGEQDVHGSASHAKSQPNNDITSAGTSFQEDTTPPPFISNTSGVEPVYTLQEIIEDHESIPVVAKDRRQEAQRSTLSGAPPQQQEEHHSGRRRQSGHEQTTKPRECAYFDCLFFVGTDLVTVTRNGWGHSTSHEWLRAWVFRPRESVWLKHAPPSLARYDGASGWNLLSGDACIGRDETRSKGLVFTHYAYALEEQVRFKDHFYGHSEPPTPVVEQPDVTAAPFTHAVDAVAEWRALQIATPPLVLADHLTWLHREGSSTDPRLLTTIADRPSVYTRATRSADEHGYRGYVGDGENGVRGDVSASARHRPCNGSGDLDTCLTVNEFRAVPLEPFLHMMAGKRGPHSQTAAQLVRSEAHGDRIIDNRADIGMGIRPIREGVSGAALRSRRHRPLTHEVDTRLRNPRKVQRSGSGEAIEGTAGADQDRRDCGALHLVVDGVVFQLEAATPKGISRVWANVLPMMLKRLAEFEGTCLRFLVRGLAPPPGMIAQAFAGLSPQRFSITHVPPRSRSVGVVADQLMLSWAVRDARASAFVSTLYTQPFQATTPNVAQLLLIHDVLPEVLGWDMSSGEWLEKANAISSADAVVAVSLHSACEFLRVYPHVTWSSAGEDGTTLRRKGNDETRATVSTPVWAAYNAVDTAVFRPMSDDEVDGTEVFRRAAGLEGGAPYVMIVGSRLGYKNALAAYRALGLARTSSVSSPALSLVLVGGGKIKPEELELLEEVGSWSHIGAGSTGKVDARSGPTVVSDQLLAAGYSGAVALLHLSLAEGFGLTVLEAFACGCPVVATDIPPIREIAGLPERPRASPSSLSSSPVRKIKETVNATERYPSPTLVSQGELDRADNDNEDGFRYPGDERKKAAMPTSSEQGRSSTGGRGRTAPEERGDLPARERGTTRGLYDGAVSDLEGGLILIEDPTSAAQVWRAVRAFMAIDVEHKAMLSAALVRRAKAFDSWEPLADALLKAVVV